VSWDASLTCFTQPLQGQLNLTPKGVFKPGQTAGSCPRPWHPEQGGTEPDICQTHRWMPMPGPELPSPLLRSAAEGRFELLPSLSL